MSKRRNRTARQKERAVKTAEKQVSFLDRQTQPESVYSSGISSVSGRVAPDLYINSDTALSYGPVFACLRLTIEPIAAMPILHMIRTPDGGQVRLDSDLDYLLNIQPNPEMSAYNFKKALLLQSRLWGCGYAEIERDMAGRPIWLWPLNVERIWPKRKNTYGALYYEYWNDTGGRVDLDLQDVLAFKGGLTFDGFTSYAPLQLAAKSMGIGLAEERFRLSFFANGAFPGGVIINKGKKLGPEGVDNLLENFNSAHQGPSRAHRVLYLDGGMEYEALKIPIESAMLLEQGNFQVEEIARWFGVPPHKLGLLGRSTTEGSVEQQNMQFVGDVLIPIMTEMEGEIAIKLLGRNNRSRQFFRLDPSTLLRGDQKSRYESYATAIRWGFLNRNEVRMKEGLSPVDGLDAYMVPMNMITSDQLGEDSTEEATSAEDTSESDMADMQAEISDLKNWSKRIYDAQVLQLKGRNEPVTLNVSMPANEFSMTPTLALPEIRVDVKSPENQINIKPEFKVDGIHIDGAHTVVENTYRNEFVMGNYDIRVDGAQVEYKNEVHVEGSHIEAPKVENRYAFDIQVPETKVESYVETGPIHNTFEIDARPNVRVEVQSEPVEIKIPDTVVNVVNEIESRELLPPIVNVVAESQPTILNEIRVPEQIQPDVKIENIVNVAPSPAPDIFLQVDREEDGGKEL